MDNMSVYCLLSPVIVDIHGHRFKIFTLVSKIHDNVVSYGNEKHLWTRRCNWLTRLLFSVFLVGQFHFSQCQTVEIAPTSQKMVIIEAPFIKELAGMAMVKLLDMIEQP